MDVTTIGIYLLSMGLVGFMGCLFIDVIDRKTDESLGLRIKTEKKLKKYKK